MKINVAITMEIRADARQSIWFNGANQHCVYLYMLLKRLPLVGEVWLVHGDGVAAYAEGMMLGELAGALRPLSAVVHQTDLLIEMNALVHPTHVEAVRQRGGHCVSYRFGNDYVVAVETINFQANPWLPNPHRVQFDELWTNPQHAHTCKSYFEAVYRAPVHVLPHVWSPYFLEQSLAANAELKARFGYRNQGPAKRIAFFEPNLNVVKSSLIPMLAANECHVRRPELVQHVYMTNTFDKKENTAFKHIALGLRMVQDGKATADPRGPFVEWAAHHTDIVVSHQWENGLNYLLYEALYGNYALVHNSPFLREVGYYYPEFEVFEAAAAIERAAETHDAQLAAQAETNAAFLRTLDPAHAPNIEAHDARIRALFSN